MTRRTPQEVRCVDCGETTVLIVDGRSARRCGECRRERALYMERKRYHESVGRRVEDLDSRAAPPRPAVEVALPPPRPVLDGYGRLLGYSVWDGGTLAPFFAEGRA